MGRVWLSAPRDGATGEMRAEPIAAARIQVRRRGWTRRLGAAASDASGATMVEFALVAPILVIMLMIVIEFGLMFTAQGILDSAALRASRVGSTGYTPTGETRDAYIRRYVSEQAFGLISASKLEISATAYSDFASIGKAGGTSGFGTSGQVVDYTLTYPWTGITPLVGGFFTKRNITLRAQLAARNEAW